MSVLGLYSQAKKTNDCLTSAKTILVHIIYKTYWHNVLDKDKWIYVKAGLTSFYEDKFTYSKRTLYLLPWRQVKKGSKVHVTNVTITLLSSSYCFKKLQGLILRNLNYKVYKCFHIQIDVII